MYEEIENECRAAVLHDNMDLARLMVHAQQFEESRLTKRNMEAKEAKSFEGSSSKSRLDVQDKPLFKKRFSNQVSSNLSKNHNDRGSSTNPQEGRNGDPPKERPTYGVCGKKHGDESLVGTSN